MQKKHKVNSDITQLKNTEYYCQLYFQALIFINYTKLCRKKSQQISANCFLKSTRDIKIEFFTQKMYIINFYKFELRL